MEKRNSKTYWLVFVGVVLLAAIVIFCVWLPYKNKTKAPEANKNTNSYIETALEAPDAAKQAVLQENINQYSTAIADNPENIQNYIDKSEAEYQTGDKQAALDTVNEGLKIDPNNDLLKNKRDVLEKDYISNSNIDTPRE